MNIGNQTDTTVLIFDYLFMVRMPKIQITSVEYIKMFGTPTTEHPEIDAELANEWHTTMTNIATMVDYFKEGVQIKVVKYEDVKTIYEFITQHLQAWKRHLEYGLNVGDAPIEDLIAMDQFANAVYDHAKFQFTPETVSSLLLEKMSNITRFNKHNFFTKPLPLASKSDSVVKINASDEKTDTYPERESLADMLKGKAIGSRRWT